ncbi:PepSY-associated TM helix domain-containing protein [Stenotrophomonas sp. MH1]|uniref:PepSY-associated TM helix domain-containing protein n=1 Tax=Stenotrophomonas capsici TaxID=3110230 RepID=A0ABU5V266_9GAMM|nr:PepSY-associated TM helix domain-containing protein [Stenotrophomonas sp. MH1]MEA5667458.1 PepSY-associated TM helix domain-containing protein [Stenotrophomonas sp. MH1]
MSADRASTNTVQQQASRGFWLRTLHQWHWISSAVCLIGMLLFSITGITLNHASKIEAKPQVQNLQLELPAPVLKALGTREDGNAPLPARVSDWLSARLDVSIGQRPAEWSPEEIYLSMPGPGADAWLSIDRQTGAVEFEKTRRGWVSYFNDLHKGRNAGPGWGWFLDLFAVACLVFCITGLFLLHLHARQRRMTWPLVGLGLLIPLLIALLLIH